MNKSNLNDFLSKTLTTYTFLLVIIFIMKLVGLDYFGISQETNVIILLDNLLSIYSVRTFVNFSLIMIYQHIMMSIILKKDVLKYTLISIPFTFLFNGYVKSYFWGSWLSIIIEILYLLILCCLAEKLNKIIFKRFMLVVLMNLLFQVISNVTRNNGCVLYVPSLSIDLILNIDYLLMMLIAYKIHKMEGEEKICQKYQVVVGSFLQKKQRLETLLKKLQKNLDNFKKKSRVEKLEISIFVVLSLLWNTLSVVLILVVAKLNDTLIECIFILTSFWLSKTAFGKPFHFSKMSTCFIVSNLTYYALNRITTPLGISIIVPIILGVGLSYVTSKFVKPVATKLYKGMPEDDFNNSILNVTDKDSLQYKICHMFYVERKSELEIAHNVGYSIDNIKKIKAKINKKIKELD